MKFSSQEEFGLRCLIQLAKRGVLTIPEIARSEGMSEAHTAKLLSILKKEGFVVANRGQSGGYSLARNASEIRVSDILSILGGKLYDAEFCRKHSGSLEICANAVDCSVRSLWMTLQEAIDGVLARLTLADMVGRDKPNVTFFEAPPTATGVK